MCCYIYQLLICTCTVLTSRAVDVIKRPVWVKFLPKANLTGAKKRKPCVKIKTSDELGFIETNRWRRFKFLPKANLTGAKKRKLGWRPKRWVLVVTFDGRCTQSVSEVWAYGLEMPLGCVGYRAHRCEIPTGASERLLRASPLRVASPQ